VAKLLAEVEIKEKEHAMEKNVYEKLADEKTEAPSTPPVVAFDGNEAADVMARFINDEDATAVFEELPSMRRPGRPNASGHHGESVQERFRIPSSWMAYVNEAVKRENLSSRSEYYRTLISRDAASHENKQKQYS
jgi:hypothetical protein